MAPESIERGVRWIVGAAGIVTLAVALWKGVWRGLRRAPGRTTGAGGSVLRAPLQLALGALWIGVCLVLWRPIPLVLSRPARIAALILGALLAFPGLALYWWGAGALGEMYKPSSALGVQLNVEHKLVTHGPFALVRHPLYLGLQLGAFGGLLIYRTWTLAFVALNFLALVLRARREEEALAAEFGEEWAAYARRVPGWVPCLRRHRGDRL